MEQGLKYTFDTYKLWYDTTKILLNNTKKSFEEFKTIQNPTQEEIKEFNSKRKELFQINYMMMESHLAVDNLYANYPESYKKKIDAYDNLFLKVKTLTAEMATYMQPFNKLINQTSQEIEL